MINFKEKVITYDNDMWKIEPGNTSLRYKKGGKVSPSYRGPVFVGNCLGIKYKDNDCIYVEKDAIIIMNDVTSDSTVKKAISLSPCSGDAMSISLGKRVLTIKNGIWVFCEPPYGYKSHPLYIGDIVSKKYIGPIIVDGEIGLKDTSHSCIICTKKRYRGDFLYSFSNIRCPKDARKLSSKFSAI